jgi:phospholipid transport system substrate-binding protein
MRCSIILAGALLAAGTAQAMPYGPGPGSSFGYGPDSMQGQRIYYYGMPREAQPGEQNPTAVLRDGMNKLVGFLKQDPKPDAARVSKFLADEIAGYFDFAYMARAAAGGAYRQMDNEQRQKLETKLREMFLTAMAQLSAYDKQEIEFLPPRRGGQRGDEVTLPVAIRGAQGYPSELDFRLYLGQDGWKVFDVVANGSSALVYYRDYFRNALRRGGPGAGPGFGPGYGPGPGPGALPY